MLANRVKCGYDCLLRELAKRVETRRGCLRRELSVDGTAYQES